MDLFSADWLTVFFQVIIIDLTLTGDNAVVIGLAAAGLPAHQRARAVVIGIVAAMVIRIGLSVVATQLLQVVGLLLAGGILLLWVGWKMWRELRRPTHVEIGATALAGPGAPGGADHPRRGEKTMRQAVAQIIAADISMSLDNVLAVAGAAREHPVILVFGLVLSIMLMGFAAALLANLLNKYRWIAYVGLAIVLYVAVEMIVRGGVDLWSAPAVQNAIEEIVPGTGT